MAAGKLTCPDLSHLFPNKHTFSFCKFSLPPPHHSNYSNRHGPRAFFRLVSRRLLPPLVLALALTLQYHLATASASTNQQFAPTPSVPKVLSTTAPLSLYSTRASAVSTPLRSIAAYSDRSYPIHYTTTPTTPTVISTQASPLVSLIPQQVGAAAATTAAGYPPPSTGYSTSVNHNDNQAYQASAIGSSGRTTYANDNHSQAPGASRHYQSTRPPPRLQPSPHLASAQPKSYKFTLTAGKYWKFNIKSNSLLTTSHKNKELRLHRNISNTNFIIDDDSWFQYNPSQQQLFAWPSLVTKPATYYFVLMPVGQDIEPLEDENGVNNIEIIASIVVELIRPLNTASRASELSQSFDYYFTLNNIHRQPSYVLLLNQIISFFDFLSAPSRLAQDPTDDTQYNANSPQGSPAIPAFNQQVSKHAGIPRTNYNKLSEYLLISSNLHTNTEHFSLIWTYEPSLVNNTITSHANECRLNSLLDILTKLSKPTLASLAPSIQTSTTTTRPSEQQFDSIRSSFDSSIYYPVNVQWPLTATNPLGEAGGSELVLKLTLNNQCKQPRALDEIGGGALQLIDSESDSARGFRLNFLIKTAFNSGDKILAKSDQSTDGFTSQQLRHNQQLQQQSNSAHRSTHTSSPVLTSTVAYATSSPSADGATGYTSRGVTSIINSADQNVTKTPTIPRYALELTASTVPSTLTTLASSTPSSTIANTASSPYLGLSGTESPLQAHPTLNPQPPSQTTTLSSTTASEAESSSREQHWQTSAHNNQLDINKPQHQQQEQQQRPSSLPHEEAPATLSSVDLSFVPTTPTSTFISTSKLSDNNVNISATDGFPDTTAASIEPAQSTIQGDRRQSIVSAPTSSSTSKTTPQAKSFANFFDIVETINDTKGGKFILSSTETMMPTQVPDTSNGNVTTMESFTTIANTDGTTINVTSIPSLNPANESSLNEDLIGILNNITEYIISVAVPVSIIIGAILLLSIIIALCSLRAKRKKSQQFEVGDRFKHRYGSERKAFLKNSSRPVILEADQKSLSTGGTPQHFVQQNQLDGRKMDDSAKGRSNYLKMTRLSHGSKPDNGSSTATSFWLGSGGAGQVDKAIDKRDLGQGDS